MPVNLYLDVDGVLNAVSWQAPDWDWPDDQLTTVNGFPIRWSAHMVARINRLTERPDVAAHWLTTWGGDAATVLSRALGLHGARWPVLGDQERERAIDTLAASGEAGWWKLQAIRAHLPDGVPAVWVDDDLARDPAAIDWVEERGDLLGISPATGLALTPDDLTAIEDFVSVHTDRGGVR